MKKLIILAIIAAMPLRAWADCVEYEYAEIKNMSKEELSAAIKKNQDESLEALQRSKESYDEALEVLQRKKKPLKKDLISGDQQNSMTNKTLKKKDSNKKRRDYEEQQNRIFNQCEVQAEKLKRVYKENFPVR